MSADGAFEPLRCDAELGPELEAAMAGHRSEVDPLAALRAITGREPSVGPMLEQRGLA